MRIVQTVFGVFHHFELARELERRGHLERIYSTFPWTRLKREGLAHSRVRTFPWLHVPGMLLAARGPDLPTVQRSLSYANALSFDRWTEARVLASIRRGERIDALVGISGSSLRTGASVQRAGGVFVCDRGSTHQRYQDRIVAEEFALWGQHRPPVDLRVTEREEALYALADAITVPSTVAARSFAAMGVDAAKVRTIPYGVRLERFRPQGEAADGEFGVLFAGSVGLRKGVPYLLEAFARLRHPRKRLRVIGAVQAEIREVLERLPREDVEFLGVLPQAELAAWMSRSHVLVLPSIEEGLALVQAQAMACGCPVIGSVNSGAEDLFTDGLEGFVVPIRDAGAIVERMQELADDPERRKAMRSAALERVQSIGGWSEYGDRWERLLEELIGAKGSA